VTTTTDAVDVLMPQMGISVTEGTVTRWFRREGEAIKPDDPLLEISTDKVDTEVPSPGEGIVVKILVQEGEIAQVGAVLAIIAPEGSEVTLPAPPEASPAASPAAAVQETAAEAPAAEARPARTAVSPVVARIATAEGIDPAQVPGTGAGGRVTKKDILAFIERDAAVAITTPHAAAPTPALPATPDTPVVPGAAAPPQPLGESLSQGESAEPVNAMRRGIAAHMRRSLDTSAHVVSAFEVDMSKVVAIRRVLKREYESAYGVNPTYLAFIARATVDTLAQYPWVNGELRGEQIVTRPFVNLGLAVEVQEGKGLIVPVIRKAESLNLLGIARAIGDLAERARAKKLLAEEVDGGTFTITNPGGYGTLHGTPIINQPQVAILGTYAVVKRPWVVEDASGQDAIAIRPIMNLTLSYDHRLIDGALAGRFLRDLRGRLEDWDASSY
jgi:pyruvate dehydrogenase E2 component (dihydrolipoamide acetyltransferase)